MAECDVTLMLFVTNLSQVAEIFFGAMCKKSLQEGTESFETIGAVVLEILRADWRGRGQKIDPPPGHGLHITL